MTLRLVALALLLAACGHATTVRAGRSQPVGVGWEATTTTTADSHFTNHEVSTTTQRVSRDYRRPSETPKALSTYPKVQSGSALASWYGEGARTANGEGARTANGERFDPGAMTVAHRSLPFGTRLRLCHGGRCVVVRVNDRGPFVTGRTFDLSRAAFAALAPLGAGVVSVDWSYA